MRFLPSTRLLLSFALALVTACGDDGNDPVPPDATVRDAGPGRLPDARTDVPPDARADGGSEIPPDGGADVPPDAAPDVPPDAAPPVPTIVVDPAPLSVAEGGSASFTVRLSAPPSGDLLVYASLIYPSPLERVSDSLLFTPANYAEPQTMTVTAGRDDDLRDETGTVVIGAVGLAEVNLAVTVENVDTQTILMSDSVVVEEGRTTDFLVALSHEPLGPVQVTVASSNTSSLSVSPETLEFDASNYEVPQTVIVTGVQDANARLDIVDITLSSPGAVGAGVTVVVFDDDFPLIQVSPTTLTVGEAGSATFIMTLAFDPVDPLEVEVRVDPRVLSASPAIIRFDSSNYTVPQTVTLSGVDDANLLDESESVFLFSDVAAGENVTVTVEDDDVQTIVTSAGALAVDEGGTATFTVRLSHEPPVPLQVAVASSDAGAASVSPASLAFDFSNFATPQTVTVTGVADDDLDSESVTVTLLGAGLSVPVTVAVTDTTQPFPVDMFVRGSFNDFERDDALVFEGGATYSALISLDDQRHELKIADAAFSPERTFSIRQDGEAAIELDLPTPLQQASGGFNNTLLFLSAPGFYRFTLEASEPATPVLTVSLEDPATYFRDMYVRGSFGAFEPVDRMTYEGSGRHTALVSLSQGEHAFKISDQLFSDDATFSVSAGGLTPIALDTPTPLEPAVGDFNNTSLTISQPGVYLFDMDASDPAAPVLTITLAEAAPFAGNMYLRGGFNGFGLASELPYEGGGRYGGLVTLTQDTHAFKIADEVFSPGATFSADAGTPVVIGLDTSTTLQSVREQDSDTLLVVDNAGIYRFELDASDPAAPVLTVTLVEAAPLPMDLYVRGSFNGFGLIDALIFDGITRYEAHIELAAGHAHVQDRGRRLLARDHVLGRRHGTCGDGARRAGGVQRCSG
jgi:hypothetical protein